MDLDANRNLIAAALRRIPSGDRTALQTVYRFTSAKLFGVAYIFWANSAKPRTFCRRSM